MARPKEVSLALDMTSLEVLEGFAPGYPKLIGEPLPSLGKAAPFVKWAGGKRSIIDELVHRLPRTFNRYWEPFVGGGALFFEIHASLTSATLSDFNFELMVAYNAVKRDPLSLIGKLEVHAIRHGKAYYYKVRKRRKIQDSFELAARFLYLNKTCYNGLYRVNRKGEFNVPIGSYVNPEIVPRENILACRAALSMAQLEYREFDTITPDAGDFVYCDPPYHPVNSTSFTKYTKLEFGEAEQQRLRNFALQLHQGGVKIMLSNSDTPLIRDLYRGRPWQLATVQAPRIVNCKPDGRGAINELVITNYSV
jgi:DNA adenine methylase